ncbi:MAG: heparan-alpha-glucosaminide N-acetyltransferase domain-containing protein [Bacteroidota bacterium]
MKGRLTFIDLLRGWATLVMIEVHVVNAFLLPAVREAGWFDVLNFINGLVAPAFLFVSGFVFVLAAERKREEFRTFGFAFWKQLGRIGVIWGVGYALHLPFFSLKRVLNEATGADYLRFYQADILHCIALGLLLLFLVRLFFHQENTYRLFLGSTAAVVVLGAPLVWEIDFLNHLPAPLAAYMNGQHASQFPVFNWLGFMLLGGLMASIHRTWKETGGESTFFRAVALTGGGLILGGSLLMQLPFGLSYGSTAIRADPFFFLIRFGIILVLLVGCWVYGARRQRGDSFVFAVSRESLLVYAVHLLVIYGDFWNGRSLASLNGKSLTVAECALATTGLFLLMIGLSKGWGRLKQVSPVSARRVSFAVGLSALVLFLIRET